MKKISLLLTFLLVAFVVNAQDQVETGSDYDDYGHWALDVQFGVTKPLLPMATGYYTNTPSLWQGDIGVRYMFNELFGLKADFGIDRFHDADNSNDFESSLYRTSLQGVVNLGSVLGFSDWTNRVNLLGHAGAGMGWLNYTTPGNSDGTDKLGFVVLGLTPQVRLGNNFALTGDVSMYVNALQNKSFDGAGSTSRRGFNGYFMNASIGLTYYFNGSSDSGKKHADWNVRIPVNNAGELDDINAQLAQLANDYKALKDEQDRNHNEFKNYIKDSNNNGIPDRLEKPLDERYANSGVSLEDLINSGFVAVFFDFDSSKPTKDSKAALSTIVDYLNDNPSARVELTGYADALGKNEYNQKLSTKRADAVKKILVDAGVSESRLSTKGMGVDNSVNKSSEDARSLVRRVIFKIN